MSDKDPKHDYRYRDDAGVEVEAFQVTAAGRWATQDWPPWLNVASTAEQTGAVYTDPAAPNSLFINLPEGRFRVEQDAYLVYENGQLSVRNQDGFESAFTKVVPLPPRKLDPPSAAHINEREYRVENGKLVKLTDEERAELPPEEEPPLLTIVEGKGTTAKLNTEPPPSVFSQLRPKAEIVLELLQDGDTQAAIGILRTALSDETEWCSCAPGNCQNGPRWGCREKSPLVKK
jgi:hypothetical protein